jgi:RimJ/RimL family protein N-acetyltransferase
MNNFLPNNKNNGWIQPVKLESDNVILEPLSISHCSDLQEATKDGELSKIWYIRVPSPENMLAVIQDRIKLQESGEMFTFAVINKNTGKAVGMTSFFKIVSSSRKVDIGWTWYQQSAQRTTINTETKILLLTHAFENLQAISVGFGANWFNQKSCRAIERLGAKLDGVLRNHMIMPNGVIADYCVYSITQDEWPAIKVHLQSKLAGLY